MMKYFLILCCLLISSLSWASPLSAELRWNHFFSPSNHKDIFKDYRSYKLVYDQTYNLGPIVFHGEALTDYYIDDSNLSYYDVPEAYLSYQHVFLKPIFLNIQSVSITLGRKRKLWNFADQYWEFGLFNPLRRWNALYPEANGLIGSFLNIQASTWNLDFFVGAIYLPSSGADVNIKNEDGTVVTSSRWVLPIPNKVEIKSVVLPIHFLNLADSSLLDLFIQESYMLSFKTWTYTQDKYIWVKFVASYKPTNDIYILTNTSNNVSLKENRVEQKITILPIKQRITSLEGGLDYQRWSLIFSGGLTSIKESKAPPEDYVFIYDRGSFAYFSGFLRYSFSNNHHVQIAYLDSNYQSASFTEENSLFDQTSFILSNYKMLEGVSLDWYFKKLKNQSLQIEIKAQYQYSFDYKVAHLSLQGRYYVTPKGYVAMTLDILGSKDSQNFKRQFLNIFRGNDFVGWRIGYDF